MYHTTARGGKWLGTNREQVHNTTQLRTRHPSQQTFFMAHERKWGALYKDIPSWLELKSTWDIKVVKDRVMGSETEAQRKKNTALLRGIRTGTADRTQRACGWLVIE